MTETTYTSDALFTGKDAVVKATYTRLLEAMRALGQFGESPEQQ